MLRTFRDRAAHQHRERVRHVVKLKAPRGHSSVGFAGTEYEVQDGLVEVPDEAEAALAAHGYRRLGTDPSAPRPAVRPR